MAKAVGKFDGHILQVVTSGLATGWQTVSTQYNSSSNSLVIGKTITPKGTNSDFLIMISYCGSHTAVNKRSALTLTNSGPLDTPIFYNHYGMYFEDVNNHFAYSGINHYDTTQSSVIGTDITYNLYGGWVSASNSQQFFHKQMVIMEIAP